ncbi:RNA polymerase sigma factor [Paenibacillus sp. 1011MAR3C5]|uniref:RNA polymerase sigma factor n=1 Tax=Paenibacillus sp. 1011MAR3C5 TaxID=1675787 RepID=UPI000E6BFDF7|nr:RNA polymerase sigma factor [Paenibacillus sp. 1011MAR3C5]RJE84788.1 RNA polymerase sigma factor [Paenibacillus sp. 1011MAR3C5]
MSSSHFETLVQSHLPELRKYCRYLSGSVWDGEDLYQETLVKSFSYYSRKGDIKEVRPFLYRVAKNRWHDEYRRSGPGQQELDSAKTGAALDVDYAEVRGWMEWVARCMPLRQVVVWLLADYFGYSMKEIASGLSTTMSAVRSILFRARLRLRECHGAQPDAVFTADRKFVRELSFPIERLVYCIIRDNPAPLFRSGRGLGS